MSGFGPSKSCSLSCKKSFQILQQSQEFSILDAGIVYERTPKLFTESNAKRRIRL